jgi:hypothetical protein
MTVANDFYGEKAAWRISVRIILVLTIGTGMGVLNERNCISG